MGLLLSCKFQSTKDDSVFFIIHLVPHVWIIHLGASTLFFWLHFVEIIDTSTCDLQVVTTAICDDTLYLLLLASSLSLMPRYGVLDFNLYLVIEEENAQLFRTLTTS